ncbi:MAG TPA: hypothetical protein VGE59_02610 [Patescibacteria group bacterium]
MSRKSSHSPSPHRGPLLFLFATWGTFFVALFGRMMLFRPDGLYMGHNVVWSDWALHVALAQRFATLPVADWFVTHPLYAGGKLTYPFVVNMISGLLMRIGTPLTWAFAIPSIVCVFAFIAGVYFLFFHLLRSRAQAVVGIFLFFLSAGMGFVPFLRDVFTHHNWASLAYPPQDFSRLGQLSWETSNAITGMILPQRALLLGMTIGVWALAAIIKVFGRKKEPSDGWLLMLAGAGIGLLPITHPHSLISIAIILLVIFVSYRTAWQRWLFLGFPAALIGIPLYLKFVGGGIENPHFFSLSLGWTATSFGGWFAQWFWQWGLTLPLAGISMWILWRFGNGVSRSFFLGCFVLFLVGNIVQFQPIAWDNSKVFLWSYLGFCGLTAAFLVGLWRSHGLVRPLAVALLITLTATGLLEMIRLQRVDQHTYLVTSQEDINLGEQIREETYTTDRFLTAPVHNHFITLWAVRPILLGYTAWVYNYGFNYAQREADVKSIYTGTTDAISLLRDYGVSYVVIGPAEKNAFTVNEDFFSSRFPVAFKNSQNTVYDTRKVLAH